MLVCTVKPIVPSAKIQFHLRDKDTFARGRLQPNTRAHGFQAVDEKYGYPYTSSKILLESVRMENAMIPTKIGNRIIVIAGGIPATKKIRKQVCTEARPTTRRIVVIKNGEWIGYKPMATKAVE
jgi:hypothetical protein